MKDYYLILELTSDATSSQIKASYRDKIRFYHPDRWRDDPTMHRRAEERTREINEAYQTLIDPASRAEYDRKSPQSSAPRPQRPQAWARPEPVDMYADVARRDSWQDASHRQSQAVADHHAVSRQRILAPWLVGIILILASTFVLVSIAVDRLGEFFSADAPALPEISVSATSPEPSIPVPAVAGLTLETVATSDQWCNQPTDCDAYAIEWSPEENVLAILSSNRNIALWDYTSDTVSSVSADTCPPGGGRAASWRTLAWSPDGSLLAVGGEGDQGAIAPGTLAILDTTGWTARQCISADNVGSLTWSPDSQFIARSGDSNATQVKVWNARDGSVALGLEGAGHGWFVRWSPGGRFMAYDDSNQVIFREVATSTNLDPFNQPWTTTPNGNPTALEWSPDAGKIAIKAGNSNLYILEKIPGSVMFEHVLPAVGQFSWAPDSKRLAVASGQNIVLIDSAAGTFIEQPFDQSGTVATSTLVDDVAWSQDGQFLAVTTWQDGQSKLWIWKVQPSFY